MQQNQNDKRYQALSPQAKDSFKTLVEANNYNNTEQMELLNNTAQTKGMDKNGNTERGKVGITKKVVKQACNSLPTKVKRKSVHKVNSMQLLKQSITSQVMLKMKFINK